MNVYVTKTAHAHGEALLLLCLYVVSMSVI